MKYILGLDIGIGSVGWAVIRDEEIKRIEDFGVRLFDSGETSNGKKRSSQKRRGFRSGRRLVRRRSHRKLRLKRHLEVIGLVTEDQINHYYECCTPQPLQLREKGLTEKLEPQELAAALIHICNRRGYQDFYEIDEEQLKQLSPAEQKEYKEECTGIEKVRALMESGGYPSVASLILHDPVFNKEGSQTPDYRNHAYKSERYPISRKLLEKEVDAILSCQQAWYPCLNADAKQKIHDIIFLQRDFEDGPGDPNDPMRKYTGFLDQLGECPYYHEPRGFRYSVLADTYALINVLSQYRFTVKATDEPILLPETAQELVSFALDNGNIVIKDVQRIAKAHGQTVNTKPVGEKIDPITQCMKYCRMIKPLLEADGFDWSSLLQHTYSSTDEESLLYRIGKVISENQTPKRRIRLLKELPGVSEALAKSIAAKKTSGTVKVCPRYMRDAIEAFLRGDIYGNFQAKLVKEQEAQMQESRNAYITLPPFPKDAEFAKNPVVFRSINETRKLINAIVQRYGSPAAINLEVASEVGRSYLERERILKEQANHEKETLQAKKAVAELLGCDLEDVNASMVERYKLGELQGWVCPYCGAEIAKSQAIRPNDRTCEIDHIVPFSLILDNTHHNKCLVCHACNQRKGQRTPLMYMTGDNRAAYIARVNTALRQDKISRRKYQYLMLDNLYDDVLRDWKSRNMNDTRYIAKYLVRYLSENLVFSSDAARPVYAVKGAITSKFRRQWLNKETWGIDDKDAKRKETHLHHAVDAVVIANCIPAYVELAMDNMKLYQMFKQANRQETDEYRRYLHACVEKMQKYYHMSPQKTEEMLRYQRKAPTLIPRLREEVEVRFNTADKKLFRERLAEFYRDDPAFAALVQMPLVSYKPNRKAIGEITGANAISVREVNGKRRQIVRQTVEKLKAKDLDKLYTNDTDLRDSLKAALERVPENKTLGDVMRAENETTFQTQKGRIVRKVALIGDESPRCIRKEISEKNYSILPSNSYYCVEIYEDKKGNTRMRGITYGELRRKNKKLYLASELPEDYRTHRMYLFANDYIVVREKNGTVKFEGYYKSVFNIKQNKLYYARGCAPQQAGKALSIAMTDQFEKYEVDILGRIGGRIQCGEPLSLLRESESY